MKKILLRLWHGRNSSPADPNYDVSNRNWIGFLNIAFVGSMCLLVLSGTKFEIGAGLAQGLYAALIALSAIFCGGFLGFLFGIPRAHSGGGLPTGDATDGTANKKRRAYEENTNLEQISDWLTKIIVGVTLVQFEPIFGKLDTFAGNVSPALVPNLPTAISGKVALAVLIFLPFWGLCMRICGLEYIWFKS